MPIVPITTKSHLNYKFKELKYFNFFKKKGLVPFCIAELTKVVTNFPIVFSKINNNFALSFLTSFSPEQNLFINEKGEWIGNYIPAMYRTMPFVFPKKDNELSVLAYIEELGCVFSNETDDESCKNLFDNGDFSKPFKEKINFINTFNANMQLTLKICKDLDAAKLLTKWPLKVKFNDQDKEVEGLYKINNEKLIEYINNKNKNIHIDDLMMQLAYGQMFSVNNLEKIAALYTGVSLDTSTIQKSKSMREKVVERQQQENSEELDQLVKNLISDD